MKKNTAEIITTIETTTAVKDYRIVDNELRITKVITKKRVKKQKETTDTLSKKTISEEKIINSYPLTEIKEEEIRGKRKSETPSFLLKREGKYYWTEIPKEINLVSSGIGFHKCAMHDKVCDRLSGAPDEQGGCEKVRNFSRYIERYPWITDGYETFNTKTDSFVVLECQHFKPCPPKKTISYKELLALNLSIAQFVWEDVETIEEVARRTKEQRK